MNPDQSQAQRAEILQTLAAGPLSSSISRLSSSSRGIPSDKDFHFLYNFDEFKVPIQQIAMQSQSMLESIGSSNAVWDKEMKFPGDFDDGDDAYDWLVNVDDEIFERIDVSLDEFQERRKREEESGKPVIEDSDNGFQLVYGKKKGPSQASIHSVSGSVRVGESSLGVKMATRDKKAMGAKPKVPFHIPTIKKPQNEFNILVNNTNQPFEHVWLQRSEDGQKFIHPLEKLSVLEFVDKNIGDVEPVKPPSTESTPFKLVEEVKDLKVLAAKLHGETEFAVDLEHNQYRSFQGLTCLMQISTRTEDFVVDTLKLRIHVGPYLREVFKDPTKKKVMHGADRDIVWLQRDFGIYICNLFDTGQASRVLKLERNSLEYLLHHFCGVTANKEYQNADWRLRPLPDEMLRYAREDTHYLLHIYDIMRINLLSMPKESENSDTPLVEVYKRSYDVCMKFYEKELLTETSYLYIYGVQGAGFSAHQLAIVAGLCEWRDVVARAEDESTGYVLPNKTLLEIAKQMPVTTSKLRRLVKSKHPYVERNLGSVVSIIRHSMQNASAFEDAAEHLKEARVITASEENLVNDGPESFLPDTPTKIKTLNARCESINGGNAVNGHTPTHSPDSPQLKEHSVELGRSAAELGRDKLGGFFKYPGGNGNITIEPDSNIPGFPKEGPPISGKSGDPDSDMGMSHTVKATGATVQVLRNPSRAFGALLGNSAPKRKFDTEKKEKEEIKLEQIRSSVNLPFRPFLGRDEELKPVIAEDTRPSENLQPEKPLPMPAAGSNLEDIIVLEDSSDEEGPMHVDLETGNDQREDNSARPALEMNQEDEPMSLSDLSSSFQKCLESTNENRKSREVEKSQESGGFLQVKPFDYAAAIRFGESDERPRSLPDSRGRKKSSAVGRVQKDDGTSEFPQGRRRQAFPASGNRSATFR